MALRAFPHEGGRHPWPGKAGSTVALAMVQRGCEGRGRYVKETDSRMSGEVLMDAGEGGVVHVTLRHAGRLNAMSRAMWRQLRLVFEDIQQRSDVRCVVVAGAYGAATVSRRILVVQALPALVAFLLVLVAG